MSFENAIHARAILLDTMSLEMCAESGSGHPTSAMSIGHIVSVLMYRTMRWLPEDPNNHTSDRLVLSEGHAVPAVYAAMADIGATVDWNGEPVQLNREHLKTLREDDSPLDGHPNPMEGVTFLMLQRDHLGRAFLSRLVLDLRHERTILAEKRIVLLAMAKHVKVKLLKPLTLLWTMNLQMCCQFLTAIVTDKQER